MRGRSRDLRGADFQDLQLKQDATFCVAEEGKKKIFVQSPQNNCEKNKTETNETG